MEYADVLKDKKTTEDNVNKVTYLKTDELTFDTYYFKPGQVLDWHRHPTGDQIFTIQAGTGKFFLQEENKEEESIELKPGIAVLAPKNVWHKIVNTGSEILVASQVTKQLAGMEKR